MDANTPDDPSPEWLTTEQVAKLLQVTDRKLKSDRAAGRGLPFVRFSAGVIRYSAAAVRDYLELLTVRPPLPG